MTKEMSAGLLFVSFVVVVVLTGSHYMAWAAPELTKFYPDSASPSLVYRGVPPC